MIPLPQTLYLNGESAESRARDVVQADLELEEHQSDLQSSDLARLAPRIKRLRGPISVRTKLIESNCYKRYLLEQDRPVDVVRNFRMAELPKWVWVVEFQHRRARDVLGQPCVEAEMVLDPTSSNDHPAFELVATRGLAVDAGRLMRGDPDDRGLAQAVGDGARWRSMITQLPQDG
jgi:hypothetical protein